MYTPDIWTMTDPIMLYLHVHSWYLNHDGSNYVVSSCTLLIFEPGRIQLSFIRMYTPDIWTRTDPISFYLYVHPWYLNQDGSNYVVSSCTLLIFEPGRIRLSFICMYTPDIWTRSDPIMLYLHVHSWYLNQNGFNHLLSFYYFWYLDQEGSD